MSREIIKLFAEDQKSIQDDGNANSDPAFTRAYNEHKTRVLQTHPHNFFDLAVRELWASEPDCPESVRKSVEASHTRTVRVKAIIAEYGWPRRSSVGDVAAGAFFFLFGHADSSNTWRRTQLDTIREVFEADHFNPRLYAHLIDRIESLDGKPLIFGSVMGPGLSPGSAQLYCPLRDSVEATNKRRVEIGLPVMEEDLQKFREGATIGAYMTPLTKDRVWSMADIYGPA